jgi:putative restriction endonuclease
VRRYELANLAWPELVHAAREGRLMTYKDLAPVLGFRAARPVKFAMWPIQDLCIEKKLPPLTSIVINSATGRPGQGFVAWSGDPAEAQNAVFEFDWSSVPAPFSSADRTRRPKVFTQPGSKPDPSEYHVPDREIFVNGRGPYQDMFRKNLWRIYRGQCALCDTRLKSILVASHIIPWAVDRTNRLNPRNGILLCRSHDGLFEAGVIQVNTDLAVETYKASPGVLGRDLLEFLESHTYERLRISLSRESPDPELLKWRLQNSQIAKVWGTA